LPNSTGFAQNATWFKIKTAGDTKMGKVTDRGFLTPDSGISLGGLSLHSFKRSTPSKQTSQQSTDQSKAFGSDSAKEAPDLLAIHPEERARKLAAKD
jgi:hypothetical protein